MHVAASCPCARACDCARRGCGRRHRVRVCARPVYVGMHGSDICIYLCTPPMCICERVWYDAPDTHTCGRVLVRTMRRLCTACARVRRSLFMRRGRWNRHTYLVLIDTINAPSYIAARSYVEDRITDACAHRRRAHALRACSRACASAMRRARSPHRPMRAPTRRF